MAKSKKKNKLYVVFILIFFIIIIFSLMKIINWYINISQNNSIKEEISEAVIINEEAEEEEEKYNIDFEMLKEKNPDTVAWLKVNGTNIEYIVVKTKNNDYYLNHNFSKEHNIAGWIFADCKNKFDGTDKNIVIYGHNMRDNSMFCTLKNVIKEEWYNNKENYEIVLVTEQGEEIYEVFSVYQIKEEDYYIQTEFKDKEIFGKFLKTIKGRSLKNFGIEISENDTILTLSTCANNNKYRVVLHAKKIK